MGHRHPAKSRTGLAGGIIASDRPEVGGRLNIGRRTRTSRFDDGNERHSGQCGGASLFVELSSNEMPSGRGGSRA